MKSDGQPFVFMIMKKTAKMVRFCQGVCWFPCILTTVICQSSLHSIAKSICRMLLVRFWDYIKTKHEWKLCGLCDMRKAFNVSLHLLTPDRWLTKADICAKPKPYVAYENIYDIANKYITPLFLLCFFVNHLWQYMFNMLDRLCL